ncbi:diguanylate cyclase [Xylophilus sp. Kf1]|nr:diguanylate cyclase [Xylophilus sp. Kf1]
MPLAGPVFQPADRAHLIEVTTTLESQGPHSRPAAVAEQERLAALHELQIVDTPPEAAFDDYAWLAGKICDVPISLISLVTADRDWFKAKCGLDLDSMPSNQGFCSHAIAQDDILEVSDARVDERFAGFKSVTGPPYLRFYAGAPLHGHLGHRFGTLCVLDTRPRVLSPDQRDALRRLAKRASDTLEIRRQHLAARAREEAIAELVDMLPDGVVTCDENGILKEFNATARDWHGVDARAFPPGDWAQHFGLYDALDSQLLQPDQVPLARAWKGERVRAQTITIRTSHQAPRTVSCNAHPLFGRDQRILGAVCTMHDVTVQIRFAQAMEKMALTDALTGLPNRAAWYAELERAIARAQRRGTSMVIMFIDLNGFKEINDRFGHAAGDEVLKNFSFRLKNCCRRNDYVARLSGDEFVVCLDQTANGTQDLHQVARKIHRSMASAMSLDGQAVTVGCSIGFAVESGPDFDAARLMEKADQAMYAAKRDKSLGFFQRVDG